MKRVAGYGPKRASISRASEVGGAVRVDAGVVRAPAHERRATGRPAQIEVRRVEDTLRSGESAENGIGDRCPLDTRVALRVEVTAAKRVVRLRAEAEAHVLPGETGALGGAVLEIEARAATRAARASRGMRPARDHLVRDARGS